MEIKEQSWIEKYKEYRKANGLPWYGEHWWEDSDAETEKKTDEMSRVQKDS